MNRDNQFWHKATALRSARKSRVPAFPPIAKGKERPDAASERPVTITREDGVALTVPELPADLAELSSALSAETLDSVWNPQQ